MDIKFGKEYLFCNPSNGEAAIMKVENLGVVKRTRYSLRFKVQNYIQFEGKPWEKIQVEDFNKLGLFLICEYDPRTLTVENALKAYRKAGYKVKAEVLYIALGYMEQANTRTRSWCIARGYADYKKLELTE